MKFLAKNKVSEIYSENITYVSGSDNSELRLKLLNEQMNFCAYTEKYISGIDSAEVEHFDPSKKNNDDYFNYYTTLRFANERKMGKYKEHIGSDFFNSLFFQNSADFNKRIKYNDFVYEVVDEGDEDAKKLIDYLGFNDDYLFSVRIKHIQRLRETIGTFNPEEKLEYFRKNKEDLSFITAIEKELNIDLSEIIN
jgi:hypothetical protein